MRAYSTLASIFLLAALSLADVNYTVKIDPSGSDLKVKMILPSKGEKVSVQIPNWAPGSYSYSDNFRNIQDVKATRAGEDTEVEHPDNNTWDVPTGKSGEVTIEYRVVRGPNTERMHLTGPSTYLYVVGRKAEPCHVTFEIPQTWRTTCGLQGEDNKYSAPDYDTLADNPVTVGIFESDYYVSHGVPHEIAYFGGDVKSVDRAKVLDYCRRVTDAEARFWGGLPFKKYVWHFTVMPGPDGGWGLEHLSSTTMGIAAGLGKGTVSVMAHELFHAWNVKRIRPKVLGPFNYLELPKTGGLWLSEGVTDYYADLLLFRYGIFDEGYMLDNIVSNTRTNRANDQRFKISPYDASLRVNEANNGRGNSSGLGISYYTTGWLAGFCLDTELRSTTNGKYSLDDLMHRLWEQCKDGKPGFEEGDIRKILVSLGGEHMGQCYDEWVTKPGELPIEQQAAKLGILVQTIQESYDDPGFEFRPNRNSGQVTVTRDYEELGLKRGDEIVKVGDIAKADSAAQIADTLSKWQKELTRGRTVSVTFKRGDDEFTKEIAVKEGKRPVIKAEISPTASAAQNALRKDWGTPKN